MARSTSRGGWPPVRWRTQPRNAVGAWVTAAAAVLLAAAEGAELVPLGPGTLVAPFEVWDSRARTCRARLDAWYLVPLAVTAICRELEAEPAADDPSADDAAAADDDEADAAGAAAAYLEAGPEDEDIDPPACDIPYPMPAITARPASTEVALMSERERDPG